jgi:aubergine-like protein
MSVCSKILLQINAKLSGVSYMAKLDEEIKKRKLMIIGVDSSHIKGKRTGVAMVATINTSFTNFYNKETIIHEDKKEQLQFCISAFIKEALSQYQQLNKKLTGGIIIYRQGVSLQQKEFLKSEVTNIEKVCEENKVLYYYILVNTKTTYKFFEKNNNKFSNPGEGLLVLDGVTNRNFFEFYIQPQLVTGGSATPSCFHVAYGNLDFPEIVPKLTFDLCHLYSNWQGTVRVPHVLKSAEKLSKMTAKYTLGELNDSLKIGQSYL